MERARSNFNLSTQWPVILAFVALFLGISWFTTAFPRSVLTTPVLVFAFMLILIVLSLFTMSVVVADDRIMRRSLFGRAEVKPSEVASLVLRSSGLTRNVVLAVRGAGVMTIPVGYLGNGEAVARALVVVVRKANKGASVDPGLLAWLGERV